MGLPQVHSMEVNPVPHQQQAIVVDQDGNFVRTDTAPCPPLASDQFYVKTEAVAINPSDTKMLGDFQTKGGILGSDYAGTVIAVGANVKDISIGDRVCGVTNAMTKQRPDRGGFAQYNASVGRIYLKLPDSWSFEAGASLCAGLCTAALAIRSLGLPLPDKPAVVPKTVLVYGGSTATGTLAMQLLRA
jgi:NADPH:quinone reductase-like Zn-dependent oxidoreductase